MPDGRLLKLGIRAGEQLQGFDADWTLPAQEVAPASARWGLVGSAVSVPVAEWIGRRLLAPAAYDIARDRPFSEVGRAPRAARFDGRKRHSVLISADPLGVHPPTLLEAMRMDEPVLLSPKATAGFLGRTRRAKLRFEAGFIPAVERHLLAVGGSMSSIPTGPQAELDLLAA
jgi:DNA (cytosine-5)-methyltransferase 1